MNTVAYNYFNDPAAGSGLGVFWLVIPAMFGALLLALCGMVKAGASRWLAERRAARATAWEEWSAYADEFDIER